MDDTKRPKARSGESIPCVGDGKVRAHYEIGTTCYHDLIRAGAGIAGKPESEDRTDTECLARRLFASREQTRHVPLPPRIVDAVNSLRENAQAAERMLSGLAELDRAEPLNIAYEWPVDDGKIAKLAVVCCDPRDNAQREVHLCWQNAAGKFGTAPIILGFDATRGIAEAEMRFLCLENPVPRTETATRAFVSDMFTALVARAMELNSSLEIGVGPFPGGPMAHGNA